jgi:hypothetical protein
MKKNAFFMLGMSAALLTFGLILAGCDNGTSENTDPKTLVITGISSDMMSSINDPRIGIVPTGETSPVAGASGDALSDSGTTVTASLYAAPDYSNRWTGSGTYDVYIMDGSTPKHQASGVVFDSATTTLTLNNFSSL